MVQIICGIILAVIGNLLENIAERRWKDELLFYNFNEIHSQIWYVYFYFTERRLYMFVPILFLWLIMGYVWKIVKNE